MADAAGSLPEILSPPMWQDTVNVSLRVSRKLWKSAPISFFTQSFQSILDGYGFGLAKGECSSYLLLVHATLAGCVLQRRGLPFWAIDDM